MKNLTILFLVLFYNLDSQNLDFNINYGDELLTLDKKYYSEKIKDSIEINTLKFYISNIKYYKNTIKTSWIQNPIIVSLNENKTSINTLDEFSQFDSIGFDLGIDSITNVSGDMNGDLDPIRGMYWTWQSGFINFKLEGKSKACQTRKNIFKYHIGGCAFPFSAIQSMGFKLYHKNNVDIVLDIKKIVDSIDISSINEIMSPRKEAVDISKIIAKSFSIENY